MPASFVENTQIADWMPHAYVVIKGFLPAKLTNAAIPVGERRLLTPVPDRQEVSGTPNAIFPIPTLFACTYNTCIAQVT